MSRHLRPRSWIILLGLAALLLGPISSARAQGTRGVVPEPISSRDISRLANRLDLDDTQIEAVAAAHDVYLQAFRLLREGEIEALIQQATAITTEGMRNLNSETIRAVTTNAEQVMSKVKTLDDRFFTTIHGALSEEQAETLPRLMQRRARKRYSTGVVMLVRQFNRAASVDLSELYEDLELSDDARRASEAFVVNYEAKLTKTAGKLSTTSTRMFLTAIETIEAAGIDLENLNDPSEAAQYMTTIMDAVTQATVEPRDHATEIVDLNRKTMRELTALLPGEAGDRLQSRYLRRAYPELPRANATENALKVIDSLDGLSDDTLEQVEGIAAGFRAQRDVKVNEFVGYVDGFRKNVTPMQFVGPGRRTYRDKLNGYRKDFESLDETTMAALEALLGDQADRLRRVARDDEEGPSDSLPSPAVAIYNAAGPDAYIPRPISTRDVTRYRRQLSLSEEDRFILEMLHDDYLDAWSALRDTDIVTLQRTNSEIRRALRVENDEEVTTPDAVSAMYGLRRRVLASILELDAGFFGDIESLVVTPEQKSTISRLRRARLRTVYNRGVSAMEDASNPRAQWMQQVSGSSDESSVDVAAVIADLELPDETRRTVDAALESYEGEAAEAFRQQYETVMRLREEADMREAEPVEDTDESRRRRWEGWQERVTAYNDAMRAAREPIIALNRATLSRVMEAAGEQRAHAVRNAYNRWAYPAAFDEQGSAERFIEAARRLDLDPDTHARLDEIASEYLPAYETVCDKLVAKHVAAADIQTNVTFDRGYWREAEERRRDRELLEFDRSEINARAMRRLRSLLDERQRVRIGMPEEADAG